MPELQSIDQWSLSNNVSDELEKRNKYSEYVKDSYFKEGKFDSDINKTVDQARFDSLSDPVLGLSKEDIDKQFAPTDIPFERKFDYVYHNTNDQDVGYADMRRFYITKKNLDAGNIVGPDLDTLTAAMPELEAKAKAATDANYDKVQMNLLSEGTIPFAKVKDAKGDTRYVGGDIAKNMSPYDAYQQGKRMGFLNSDDALAIQEAYTIPKGSTVPKFQQDNYDKSRAAASSLFNNDADFKKDILKLSETLGNIDHNRGDSTNFINNRYKMLIDRMEEKIPEISSLPDADKRAALEFLGGTIAADSGQLKFREGEEITKNLHYFGYGDPVIHRDALIKKSVFDAVTANPDLTPDQRAGLDTLRQSKLDSTFDTYGQVFKDTYLSDEWTNAVQTGFAQNKKKSEILDQFLNTHDYNYFNNEIVGAIGSSIYDSVADIYHTVGVIGNNAASRDALLKSQRERSSRRTLANVFGEDFGVTTTFGEMVAPVVADMVTMAALTEAGGIGGAAYAGARITAKGVVTGIVKGALARAATETVEDAAARLVTKGLVKATATQTAQQSAAVAIKSYAETTANKYLIRSTQFVTTATRQGGNTYASIYSSLQDSPEGKQMSAEEKHSRALAGGMIAATITGATTVGFSMMGRGGLEDFMLGGATPRQMKAVLSKIKGINFPVGELESQEANKIFNSVVAKTVKEGYKNLFKTSATMGVVKDFTDEAVEEGVQDFINGFVETGFTDQDRPMLDRIKQSGMSAVYGGVFGGTVGAFRATLGRVARGGEIDAESRDAAMSSVVGQIAEGLRTSGSPLTAQAIQDRLFAPQQKAVTPTPTPEESGSAPTNAIRPFTSSAVANRLRASAEENQALRPVEDPALSNAIRKPFATSNVADRLRGVGVDNTGNYSEVSDTGNYSDVTDSGQYSEITPSGKYSSVTDSGVYATPDSNQPVQDTNLTNAIGRSSQPSGVAQRLRASKNSVGIVSVGNDTVQDLNLSRAIRTPFTSSEVAQRLRNSQENDGDINTGNYSSQPNSGRYSSVEDLGSYSDEALTPDQKADEILNRLRDVSPEEFRVAVQGAYLETSEKSLPDFTDHISSPIAIEESPIVDTRLVFPQSEADKNLKYSIQSQPDDSLSFTKQEFDSTVQALVKRGLTLEAADKRIRERLSSQSAVDPFQTSPVADRMRAGIVDEVPPAPPAPPKEPKAPKAPKAPKISEDAKAEAEIARIEKLKAADEERVRGASIAVQIANEQIPKVLDYLSDQGAVVRFKKSAAFGMPANYSDAIEYNELSNMLAKRTFAKYPPLSLGEVVELYGLPPNLMESKSTPKLSWFNPFTGNYEQDVSIRYKIFRDNGIRQGVFDNNPFTVAHILKLKIPIIVPQNFDGAVNKAIKFYKGSRVIYDVQFPSPSNPFEKISIVHKDKIKPTENEVAKTIAEGFDLLAGFNSSVESKVTVSRNLNDITETSESKESSLAEAIIKVNNFFGNVYSTITQNVGSDNTLYMKNIGASKRLFKLASLDRLRLRSDEVQEVRLNFMMEVIPEFTRALAYGHIVQSLQASDILVRNGSTYSIKPEGVEQARSILLNSFSVPSDAKLDQDLKAESEEDKKAGFLYTFGFKTGSVKPEILVSVKKNATRTLDPQWATKVVDQFLLNTINDNIAHPDKKGDFPNVPSIVSRIRDRINDRLKYDRESKNNAQADAYSKLSRSDLTPNEFEVALNEVYGYDEDTSMYLHTTDNPKSLASINTAIIQDAYSVLRTDREAARAIKRLAKQTSFKSNPEIVDDMMPVDVFTSIAQWASPAGNRFSVMDSHTFRRQVLDNFKESSATSKSVYDAFEASGVFHHQFKKQWDKGLQERMLRLGFTEAEIKFMRQDSRAVKDLISTGMDSGEAASTVMAARAGQRSYAAPSFISDKYRAFYRNKNNQEVQRLNLESGNVESVISALNLIAKSSKDKNHKSVAKLLLKNPELIRNVQFVITDINNNDAGNFVRLESGGYRVSVNLAGYYGNGVESVLLHEYVHALTVDLLTRPDASLTPAQRTAKVRLKGLYELSKVAYAENSRLTGEHSVAFELATENFEEFIATYFSSSDFQNSLKLLKDPKTKGKNFFARIYDAILSAFGIKPTSEFDIALAALTDFTEIGNSDMARTSRDYIDRGIQEAISIGVSRRIVPVVEKVSEEQQQTRFANFGSFSENVDATPEQKEVIDILIDQAVRGLIPADVSVQVFDTQAEADEHGIFGDRTEDAIVATLMKNDAGETYPAIFINRETMAKALLNKQSTISDPLNAKAILESLIGEELDHVAEFYAISTEELNGLADSFIEQDFHNIIDSYTANPNRRLQLRESLQNDGDGEIKRQLIGEMLRIEKQKIARGYTTEEDIAFYESDPSLMRVMFRYLKGIFKRMSARYNLNKNNPEVAGMIHRMAVELRFMQAGGRIVDTNSPFDPRSPEANVEVLRRRYAATAKDINPDTTDEEIEERFKYLFDTLELPVALFHNGNYQHASSTWNKLIKGDIDERVSKLKKNQQAFERATDALGKSLTSKILKQIKKAYGSEANAPADLLADATGTTEFVDIDKELKQKYQSEYRDHIAALKARISNGEFNPETSAKLSSPEYKASVRKRLIADRVSVERSRLRDEILRKQSAALEKISLTSPELAAALLEMRKLTDAFSRKVKEQYGLKGSLAVRFDAGMGIYLTRSYRTFSEEGYVDKVLTSKDEAFVKIRDEAMEFFRELYVKKEASIRVNASTKQSKIDGSKALTKQQAMIESKDYLNDHPEIAAQLMVQYIRSYDPEYTRKRGVLSKGVTKSLIDNLKKKTNLDPRLRALLGEYSQDTEAVSNLLNTYATVTTMVARQSFYNNLILMGSSKPLLDPDGKQVVGEDGEPVEEGFLYTEEQLKALIKKDPSTQQRYANLRTGKIYVPDSKEVVPDDLGGTYDPTYNMYGPLELIEGMRKMYSPPVIDDNLTASQLATKEVSNLFNKLTGLSLGVKTLGSIGFYLRNIVSNTLFFGPSQGFIDFKSMGMSMKLIGQVVKDPNDIDAYRAELVALNILNNEMQSSLIRDLLKGRKTPESLKAEANSIMDKLQVAKQKVGVAYDKVSDVVEPLTSRLQALSGAVDGFYKMAYFHHELETFRKAKQADIDAGKTESFYAKLSDYEMKRAAADNVLATAQSYSEAPAIIQATVRSGGMFVAPFLRYKTEVPRIIFNTYKLGLKESKSDNPVIKSRGLKRLVGMSSMLFIVSAAAAEGARRMMGIGDDEDDALREAMPSYAKDNTYFYYRSNGKLMSGDLTFINPFSLVVDPVLRSLEQISRGNYSKALTSFTGALSSTYLDTQIFTGALLDVYNNQDRSTKQPIAYESDGIMQYAKKLGYIIDNSFNPRIVQKAWEAFNSSQGLAVDEKYAPLHILWDESKPIRPREVNVTESATKFLRNKQKERNDLTGRINQLKTQRALSNEDVKGLARDWVETRVRIDEEVYKGLRGFLNIPNSGFGIREAAGLMKQQDMGYGDRRISLIFNGLSEKPVPNPAFIEKVLGLGDVGVQRMKTFNDELNRYTRYIKLNPQ